LKVLLDECTARVVKMRLQPRTISTVQERGQGIKNGELLKRAEQEFDVLVTADRNLPRQQNLSGRRLAVVVLPSNQVPVVVRLLPELERVLDTIQPGTLVEL
jgi:hypothetical protein